MPRACNFIKKETLTQVFFSEFCEIFKNTFLTEHVRATVYIKNETKISETYWKHRQTSKIELLLIIIFGKKLHLRCLTGPKYDSGFSRAYMKTFWLRSFKDHLAL